MRRRPIAVTQRTVTPRPGDHHDALSRNWAPVFDRYGLLPLLIPNDIANPLELLAHVEIEALMLSGGDDVGAPEAVGRDRTELALIAYALARNLPILGICRGHQLLNVHFGGQLVSGLTTHRGLVHPVRLEGILAEKVGAESLGVNSFHSFGVRPEGLAAEMVPLAYSEDGLVEAMQHRDLPVLSVQWHPERQEDLGPLDDFLFGEFL